MWIYCLLPPYFVFDVMTNVIRASSYAERMHLRIAVIHGQKDAERDDDDENYGRSSSPPPFIEEEPEEPTTFVIPPHLRRKRTDSSKLKIEVIRLCMRQLIYFILGDQLWLSKP